jgi:hypothetical protein
MILESIIIGFCICVAGNCVMRGLAYLGDALIDGVKELKKFSAESVEIKMEEVGGWSD